jgi:copper(I)-binding protein
MHTTTLEASGTTMRPLDKITIAPNGQIVFQPGGNHLMIRNLSAEAKSLAMTMTFDNGGSLNTSFTVIPMDAWMNATR